MHPPSRLDPFFTVADVVGLYHPDQAAAAARITLTDDGSGNWKLDDK